MTYVDGFVIAVPTSSRQRFIDHARSANSVFMDHGALRIFECWGDDVPVGKQTDFRRAVDAREDESVAFSWVEWPDKATRDAALAGLREVMQTDPRSDPARNPMPFDGARMIWGGFSPVVVYESQGDNQPGDFIWYELMTDDPDTVQKFYGDLLDWQFADSGQAGMDYRLISVGPNAVGGLLVLQPQMIESGAQPTWLSYIAVDDVDRQVAQIVDRGGQTMMPPSDVPGVGRMAMVTDPQGAPFYIMTPFGEGKSRAFADDGPRPGHCAWNELSTPSPESAWQFYGGLFGWGQAGELDMGPAGAYQFIRHRSVIGAVMPAQGSDKAGWTQYFRVPDINAARAKVEAGGGKVVSGPDEIPGGEYAMNCIDPRGAAFGLVGGGGSEA